MKISTKLGGGYLVILLMVFLCSAAGLYGINKLSGLLDFITGPAWNTADGAMEGAIGIEAELIGVSQFIAKQTSKTAALALIDEGKATAKEALGRMESSGLLSAAELTTLNQQKSVYADSQSALLSSYQRFESADSKLRASFSDFQQLMGQAEELGDSAVESLESQPDQLISWNQGLSTKWSAADGGMETQIAMLSRFFYYQNLLAVMDPAKESEEAVAREGLAASLADLKEKVAEIELHPLFQSENVINGPFKGSSYATAVKQAFDQHSQDSSQAIEAFEVFRKDNNHYQQVAAQLLETIEVIEESADGKVEGQLSVVEATANTSYALMMISLFIAVVVALAIMYFVVREIIHAIQGMTYASEKIAGGDLTIRMCRPGQKASNDELSRLNTNMGKMSEGLRNTISQVASTSNMLASQAEELSLIANETRENVLEQQKRTSSVASAVTEMTASSREVAHNTESARDSASQAERYSKEGRVIVDQTISSIKSLSAEVDATADVVQQLTEDSEKIGSVLDVIRGIAEQTNLLALNAAIEAARAGEQGRGFAVVADEVRTLAQKTQASTQEIQEVIEGLQQRTQQAHVSMKDSQEQVLSSTEKAKQAEEALQKIADEVASIAEQNTQIAAAMNQQEGATEEINSSVVEIEHQADQAVSAVNQTSESSRELARQASSLQELVSHFKI